MNTAVRGKRIELSEGFLNAHVVLSGCKLYSALQHLIVEVPFSGSLSGTLYVSGVPFYNPQLQQIELQNVAYDLKTKSLLLKGAKWLFGNRVLQELKKYSVLDLAKMYQDAAGRMQAQLNQHWGKNIQASGAVTELSITHISVQPRQLLIRLQCNGRLQIAITGLELKI